MIDHPGRAFAAVPVVLLRYSTRILVAATSVCIAFAAADRACAATPPDLAKLQRQVAEWRTHASPQSLSLAERRHANLAECTDEAAAQGRALEHGGVLAVDEEEYTYVGIEVDDERDCLFMVKPLHRGLSLAEAIDVSDADLMAADMPIKPKVYSAAEVAAANARLAELVALVRSGDYAPFDPQHPVSPVDIGARADCSHVDPRELAAHAINRQAGYIYNGGYAWGMVQRPDGAACIYLEPPIDRGLRADEAMAFEMAQRVHLHPEADKQRTGPDFQAMIAAALNRFDAAAAMPAGAPKNLIDCRDVGADGTDGADDAKSTSGELWIHDGVYSWSFLYRPGGTCLIVGGYRGLSVAEARAFLQAIPSGIADAKHAAAQRAFNCQAKVSQRYGGTMPAYEAGSINGWRYRVFYASLDPELHRLDEAQHALVETRKAAWRQWPANTVHRADVPSDIEVRIYPYGRTRELAAIDLTETRLPVRDVRGSNATHVTRMLHVPSGRLLALDDLFADPAAARAHIVELFLRRLPRRLENSMAGIAFMGSDSDEQEREFRERYLTASRYYATTPADRFARFWVIAGGNEGPSLAGTFSDALLPDFMPPEWKVSPKDIGAYLKPEFHGVLDAIPCPDMPAQD